MDYSKMTDQEFSDILEELTSEMSASEVLSFSGVREIVSEELNNEILTIWEGRQEGE